jgi:hypothetical protein
MERSIREEMWESNGQEGWKQLVWVIRVMVLRVVISGLWFSGGYLKGIGLGGNNSGVWDTRVDLRGMEYEG